MTGLTAVPFEPGQIVVARERSIRFALDVQRDRRRRGMM